MPQKKARAVGMNHVALEVGDIEKALDFYGQLFEIRLRGRSDTMAFIDLGDQFLNLTEGRTQQPDEARHFGLVVDDREALRRQLEKTQARILPSKGLDFLDPWGNHVQVVEYASIQFSKTAAVLRGMGLSDLDKTEEARAELAEKGMSDD